MGDVGSRRIEYGDPPESLFANVVDRIKEADIAVSNSNAIFPPEAAYSTDFTRMVLFSPCWINHTGRPRFLLPDEAGFQQVVGYMARWCGDLGTELRVSGEKVIVRQEDNAVVTH